MRYLTGSVKDAGKVAANGTSFDIDKADVEPESEPARAEIAKLRKARPEMKVPVVGRTDNAGTFDHNLTLSGAGATAVTNALVKSCGVEPGRMRPFGVGAAAPVAPNRSERGRAKNRRVGLADR